MSVLGEITEKGKKKFQDQLEDTHLLFKEFVKSQRPKLDVDKVSTGEYWLASRSLDLGLVDALSTSDDYLIRRAADASVYRVSFETPGSIRDRLSRATAEVAERTVLALLSRVMSLRLQ